MKISICIPQYNRIAFLLKNLEIIEKQTYPDIEIVISDDCSKDNTEQKINDLIPFYKYPIIYRRNPVNLGYDRNLRQSIELATGDYCLTLGNDDSFSSPDGIQFISDFLINNNYPEIGFCNMAEAADPKILFTRASITGIIGSGPEIAHSYYSCFTFVAGLIFKKSAFNKFNTAKHDGSIYAQIYLAVVMISSGLRLFSIKEPIIIKDIQVNEQKPDAYTDRIAKNWKEFKIEEGGLPSVINVLISGFRDVGVLSNKRILRIFRHIYVFTYPNWVIEYKGKGSLAAAWGLIKGLYPPRIKNFSLLNLKGKIEILLRYYFSSIAALIFPYNLFQKLKTRLYSFAKASSR